MRARAGCRGRAKPDSTRDHRVGRDARRDLWIIQELARRLGLDWKYDGEDSGAAGVFDEMRLAMPSIAGITWQRLSDEGSVTYPCRSEGDPGTPVVFTDRFPTADGRGRFVPAGLIAAAERPDGDFPMVLITGRQLGHWHTGTMTRRATVLDAIEPVPMASLHPEELQRLEVRGGDVITVESRRGAISLLARADDGMPPDGAFFPFCYHEAAANLLTNAALDPFGKIPEFKYCAVRVVAGGRLASGSRFEGEPATRNAHNV